MNGKLIPVKLQYVYRGCSVQIDNEGDDGFWWIARKFNDEHKLLFREFAHVTTIAKAKQAAINYIDDQIIKEASKDE